MRELNPKIELHTILAEQIYKALQGDVMNPIRLSCGDAESDKAYHSMLQGSSLKVQPTTLPKFYNLCHEVKEKLGYNGKLDFYITGDAEVNACASLGGDDDLPSIVNINSGLFNLMTEEEIKYVIGHEIGHIINKDSLISKLWNFVYSTEEIEEKRCPAFLKNRLTLFNKIAELGADRYGYMANENLEACITAIFKLSSGLYLQNLDINLKGLLEENEKCLQTFLGESGTKILGGSHPVNPIRIHALELFVKSKTQKALNEGMISIVDNLQEFGWSSLHDAIARFNASAGVLMAEIDGKMDKYEERYILNMVAQFSLFPERTLKDIQKRDLHKVMAESAALIRDLEPSCVLELLGYLVKLALIDDKLDERELGLIYDFCMKHLDMSESFISKYIAGFVKDEFVPQAASMNG
ncbi:MAG: M48 family metallopeptidase [Muribaculaceae bacterium]